MFFLARRRECEFNYEFNSLTCSYCSFSMLLAVSATPLRGSRRGSRRCSSGGGRPKRQPAMFQPAGSALPARRRAGQKCAISLFAPRTRGGARLAVELPSGRPRLCRNSVNGAEWVSGMGVVHLAGKNRAPYACMRGMATFTKCADIARSIARPRARADRSRSARASHARTVS